MSAVRRSVVAALAALALLWPALLVAGRWPRWWEWIAPEQTPMTWMQSVVLVLAAAGALLVALVLRLGGTSRRALLTWWLFGVGLAALAIDERFALHERVRDGVLAPRGVEVWFLPWVAPGDFLLLGVAVGGLVLLPAVWAGVSPDPAARRALVVGVVLAVVAVGLDSVDPATWTVQGERLQQTGEEMIELGSGLALLACVALRLLGLLDALAAAPGSRCDDGAGPDQRSPSAVARSDGGSPTSASTARQDPAAPARREAAPPAHPQPSPRIHAVGRDVRRW